jgi:class 3 adenylate cyclase
LAYKGAHALSTAVNNYLGRLLRIASVYGGDVVKFAGDAVLIVWEHPDEALLPHNVLCAAQCALEMQHKAGEHLIENNSLCFRIHCGISCGIFESDVFEASAHVNMQRLFHSVGGEALSEIGDLVASAQPGEVCVSAQASGCMGRHGQYREPSTNGGGGGRILVQVEIDSEIRSQLEDHIESLMDARLSRRNLSIEEDFIHPSVLRLLSHGGLSPTHIAQMRNLCVLFIAKTLSGSSVNWLIEVQAVLDRKHCPIVQILDDDKGVHVVAALNLYESLPNTGVMGVEVCRELVHRKVGCCIGMAIGATFCGVTGSSELACRWDITGPPAVRAARLMEYALEECIEVAIDQSVYSGEGAAVRLVVYSSRVQLKGFPSPVAVYTLTPATEFSSMGLLEVVHGPNHLDQIRLIADHIVCRERAAVIVTGPSLSGKKIVCQQAAGVTNTVPYLHMSAESLGMLQIARTIATWFKYARVPQIQDAAFEILQHLDEKHWSLAHDETVAIVSSAIQHGLTACFVVDRVQALDSYSISVIRECLQQNLPMSRLVPTKDAQLKFDSSTVVAFGRVSFLCVHVPSFCGKSTKDLVLSFTRSQKSSGIPVVEVGQSSAEDIRKLCEGISLKNMGVFDVDWFRTLSHDSGFCAGMFIERAIVLEVRCLCPERGCACGCLTGLIFFQPGHQRFATRPG